MKRKRTYKIFFVLIVFLFPLILFDIFWEHYDHYIEKQTAAATNVLYVERVRRLSSTTTPKHTESQILLTAVPITPINIPAEPLDFNPVTEVVIEERIVNSISPGFGGSGPVFVKNEDVNNGKMVEEEKLPESSHSTTASFSVHKGGKVLEGGNSERTPCVL